MHLHLLKARRTDASRLLQNNTRMQHTVLIDLLTPNLFFVAQTT